MKKIVACIFAHPDDEAFGPGGTIAEFAKKNDIYILCATKGEAGLEGKVEGIANIREKELIESANILGVKKVFFLGFEDGTLCNNLYHELAKKIKQRLDEIKPEILITYEPRGVSGHIDHIVISMVTSFLFEKLTYVKKLMQFCHIDWELNLMHRFLKNYFVYFPPGYNKSEIGDIIDTASVWNIKKEAILKHQSQLKDVKRILLWQSIAPKREYFLTRKK